jgi:hypothetical protein
MSIPLPALGIKPPEQASPLDQIGKVLQLRNAQQQGQSNSIDLQQKQRAMQDQQTIMETAARYNGDLSAALPELAGKISAATFIPLRKSLVDTQKGYEEMDEKKLANEKTRSDQLLGLITQAKALPPDQYQQQWPQIAQQAAAIDPRVKNHVNPAQPIPQEGLDSLAFGLATHSQLATIEQQKREQAKAEAEIVRDNAQAGAEDASTEKTKLETDLMKQYGTSAQQEAKYIALQTRKNQGLALTPQDAAFSKAYEKNKTLVPVANFNLQNGAAAADSNGNPSQIAQALAENRMKWSEAVSPRTPQAVKNQIMAQVFKLNPNYDTSEFGLEADAAKKARSGAWADTRVAYNTAIDHANQLLTAADALKNGDVQKLNSLKNFFSTQFGSPDVTNFSAIANAYNHEVTSVVSKGHITDAEVAQGHATLPDNASPEQIRGVAAAYKNLMLSKRDELDKVIKGGAGNKADGVMGVQPSGSQSSAATKTYQGHTYEQQPDGSWKLKP